MKAFIIFIMPGFQKFLYLLRAFFPSWKFFDDAGSRPELSYSIEGESDWKWISKKSHWKWFHLFINPEGNFNHALDSLIHQLLIAALNLDAEKLVESTEYQLIENWVRLDIKQASHQAPGKRFQFKISIHLPSQDDVLISHWHEV